MPKLIPFSQFNKFVAVCYVEGQPRFPELPDQEGYSFRGTASDISVNGTATSSLNYTFLPREGPIPQVIIENNKQAENLSQAAEVRHKV